MNMHLLLKKKKKLPFDNQHNYATCAVVCNQRENTQTYAFVNKEWLNHVMNTNAPLLIWQ